MAAATVSMPKHYQNSSLPLIPSAEGMVVGEQVLPPQPLQHSPWPRRLFWIACAVLVIGLATAYVYERLAEKSESKEVLSYAQALAAGINSPEIQQLSGEPHDVGTPAYEQTKQRLNLMREANPRFRFLYFMGYRDAQWFFYLDSEPTTSPDISLPGDIYEEPTKNHLWDWQADKPFVYGPYQDTWGTWVSAFVPVVDEVGTKRFFGIDISAQEWTSQNFLAASVPLSVTLLVLALIFFVYLLDAQHGRYLKKMYDDQFSLWRQHQRLDLAIRASRDGMFDVVINTGEAYYSQRLLEIIGLGKQNKKFAPFFSEFLNALHPDDHDKVVAQFQAHFISGEPFLMDFRLKHQSGEYVWVNGRGSAYFNEFGKPLRFAGFITDITEQKRLDQMRSEFISIASHQLRSPLTAIKWFCSILGNGDVGKISKEQHSCLQEIVDSNERMIQLVNDLLMVSRIERQFPLAPEKEPVKIQEVVEEVVKELDDFAKKRSVKLTYSNVAKAMPIAVERMKIREALKKIIKNAIVYSPAEEVVEVMVSFGDEEAVITVSDRGMGISKKDQAHIFEKFFRAESARLKEPEGNGLGLFIAKSYVEAHRGRITFISNVGKGTTFTITLPCSDHQ